jgi:hypothetical protein
MKLSIIVILIAFFFLPIALLSQVTNPIVFSADDTDSLIEASFEFSSLPAYNVTSTLHIKLRAINSRLMEHALEKSSRDRNLPGVRLKDMGPEKLTSPKELRLNLVVGPSRYTGFKDTVLTWGLPIVAGDSMLFAFPTTFRGVGEFSVVVSEASGSRGMVNLQATIVIGEEGKLVYLGKAPAPFKNPLGAHPYIFGDDIVDNVQGLGVALRHVEMSLPEPFDVNLKIDPNLKVGKTSIADLSIQAMSADVKQLQYEIIAATNLQIDSLSPSPDTNPGIGERFDVSFRITPQKTGRSYLSFEIFGYNPDARYSNVIYSTLKYYLIFGADGTLLYMGGVDPFAVGFTKDNPAYKPIEGIMDFANTGYGEKEYRSEPDFEYDRINNQRILDSLEADKLLDTLPEKDSTK